MDESKGNEGEYLEDCMGMDLAGQICPIRGGFGGGRRRGGRRRRLEVRKRGEKEEKERVGLGAGAGATLKWMCGARGIGATHASVAPVASAPHIEPRKNS